MAEGKIYNTMYQVMSSQVGTVSNGVVYDTPYAGGWVVPSVPAIALDMSIVPATVPGKMLSLMSEVARSINVTIKTYQMW